MIGLTESALEETTLGWLEKLGYPILPGLDIAPCEPVGEAISIAKYP